MRRTAGAAAGEGLPQHQFHHDLLRHQPQPTAGHERFGARRARSSAAIRHRASPNLRNDGSRPSWGLFVSCSASARIDAPPIASDAPYPEMSVGHPHASPTSATRP